LKCSEGVGVAFGAVGGRVCALVAIHGTGVASKVDCVFDGVTSALGLAEAGGQIEVQKGSIAFPSHHVQN
jgi:hypothetical protein